MMDEDPLSPDAELGAAWGRGEPDATRRAVELHGPAMLRVALALCPTVEDAEEVVQDALLGALRAAASFDPRRGDLRSWLVGATANRARQVRRGLSRRRGLLARLAREPYASQLPADRAGDLSYARGCLASLPPREREAFVLVQLEDLSSLEAARVMGISDSTVRVLVARARRRLQARAGRIQPQALRMEKR